MSLALIREYNSGIIIHTSKDNAFKQYGRAVEEFDFSDILCFGKKNIDISKDSIEYFCSVPKFESFNVINKIQDFVYGQCQSK